MYTTDNLEQTQKTTQSFLKNINAITIFDIEALHQCLRMHEYLYYVQDAPTLTDFEYDQLYNALKKLEAENPESVTPDSPTQRVGSSLTGNFTTVPHLVPMLSLENSYNADDLLDWDRKAKEATKLDEITYCVEPKFDGASISLLYENDFLVRGTTRGDGVAGDDITNNIKQIKSIPLKAMFSKYGVQAIEFRGEILLNKKNFEAYNKTLMEQNLPPLANPRNAASGSLRMKNPMEVGKRNLEAFVYHVAYVVNANDTPHATEAHFADLEMLWELGFKSPIKEVKVCKNIQEVIDYTAAYEAKRDTLPYEIDGMVIKVNNLALQDALGETSHHPRWAIAFKFKARQATGKLLAIEYQVGRTGAVTPVAKTEPVAIGGVMVSSISLHNEAFIKERDIKIGDTVVVERAGDVIPYIVRVLPELRTGQEQEIVYPTSCPVCESQLVKLEEEAVWRCANLTCPAQVIERIIHFASKDCMDIRGLGESQIRKFCELGFVKNIPDIYNLPYDKISTFDGFGKRSIDNMTAAIEASKTQPLHRLINAFGIRFVGENTSKILAQQVNHLYDLKTMTLEDFQSLDDVGIKVATSIVAYFSDENNIAMLQQLEALGLNLTGNKGQANTNADGSLNGKTFLFTGTLSIYKRSQAEELVEKNGGKIVSGVSSKLNYLVVGEDAGSKLEKAKKIASIMILTEKEFEALITV
jgi:DNA ligase (NAD+)